MARLEKLIARLKARPSDATFVDVRRLLEAFGWQEGGRRGSHVRFDRPGERPIVVPIVGGRKVKGRYLDAIFERLGLDDD